MHCCISLLACTACLYCPVYRSGDKTEAIERKLELLEREEEMIKEEEAVRTGSSCTACLHVLTACGVLADALMWCAWRVTAPFAH